MVRAAAQCGHTHAHAAQQMMHESHQRRGNAAPTNHTQQKWKRVRPHGVAPCEAPALAAERGLPCHTPHLSPLAPSVPASRKNLAATGGPTPHASGDAGRQQRRGCPAPARGAGHRGAMGARGCHPCGRGRPRGKHTPPCGWRLRSTRATGHPKTHHRGSSGRPARPPALTHGAAGKGVAAGLAPKQRPAVSRACTHRPQKPRNAHHPEPNPTEAA